mgnify:CR=1 FL=1
MAEENLGPAAGMDKKAAKKAEKARKKEEKRNRKLAKKEAKKNGTADEFEEESGGGKAAVVFVTLMIIVIWIAILAVLIHFDVGGFGSTVMQPILKDVPYVNKILPNIRQIEFHFHRNFPPVRVFDRQIEMKDTTFDIECSKTFGYGIVVINRHDNLKGLRFLRFPRIIERNIRKHTFVSGKHPLVSSQNVLFIKVKGNPCSQSVADVRFPNPIFSCDIFFIKFSVDKCALRHIPEVGFESEYNLIPTIEFEFTQVRFDNDRLRFCLLYTSDAADD